MRLLLHHPPPPEPAPAATCAYLDTLAGALVGVPLGAAARHLGLARSRGRHGNAVQWHLGLDPVDARSVLDWEGRIEIKLVSVWRTGQNGVACDKLKVCDHTVDPWHKLSNVLFVFADRLTRVVVGSRLFRLGHDALADLGRSFAVDPHFGDPDLFVEARESGRSRAPAYYVSRRWIARHGVLPGLSPGIFAFDAAWLSAEHGRLGSRGDPAVTVATASSGSVTCPRCGGQIRYDGPQLVERDWAPGHHPPTADPRCAATPHVVISASWLALPTVISRSDARRALEGTTSEGEVFRTCEWVGEPDDHAHEAEA